MIGGEFDNRCVALREGVEEYCKHFHLRRERHIISLCVEELEHFGQRVAIVRRQTHAKQIGENGARGRLA